MGQKVNPIGFRLGITEKWRSRWFVSKGYSKLLQEDLEVKKYLDSRLSRAGVSRIEIERSPGMLRIDLFSARPGIVIGRRGSEVDVLRADLEKMTGKQVQINILEVQNPEKDATLIAQSIAEQIQARVSFKRAMKKAVASALRAGAQGVKISCSGRLGGSEMSRTEWYREGRVPLHTLRAKIDYGFTEAKTTFGRIGVKAWVYHGEQLPEERAVSTGERGREKAVRLGDLVEKPVTGKEKEIVPPEASKTEPAEKERAKAVEEVQADKPAERAKKSSEKKEAPAKKSKAGEAEKAKPKEVKEPKKAGKASKTEKAEKTKKPEEKTKEEKTARAKADKPAEKKAAKKAAPKRGKDSKSAKKGKGES